MDTSRVIDEIKSRLNVVDTISEYIELKKAGLNYKALCPFHSEKTPSFTVSSEKQIFHCFGCGIGGDIITFVMKYEELSLIEAVKSLAERAGIKIDYHFSLDSSQSSLRKKLLDIHRECLLFYQKNLATGKKALNYLQIRGISQEIVKEFAIGYAPDDRDLVLKLLRSKGFSDIEIISSGLCKETERGTMDTFRDRIVFPIVNSRGDVIAFGGRIIKDDAYGPKYLNSPETTLFKKSYELFGINLTRTEISRKGYAIIMEGYFDVITAYMYGIKNTLAPLGTSLTSEQINKLRTLTKKVLLIFDSDEAGIKASRRAISLLFEHGLIAKVLLLPEGDDPDTFLRKKGRNVFEQLSKNAKGIIDFYLSLPGNRIDIIKELVNIISRIRDGILRGDLLREISEKTRLSEQFLREELSCLRKGPNLSQGYMKDDKVHSSEMFLLGLYLSYPEFAAHIKDHISPADIEEERLKKIFEKIFTFPDGRIPYSIFEESEISLITEARVSLNIDTEEKERNVIDCIKRIKEKKLKKKLEDLEMEIKVAENKGESQRVKKFLDQMNLLIKKTKRE